MLGGMDFFGRVLELRFPTLISRIVGRKKLGLFVAKSVRGPVPLNLLTLRVLRAAHERTRPVAHAH